MNTLIFSILSEREKHDKRDVFTREVIYHLGGFAKIKHTEASIRLSIRLQKTTVRGIFNIT
uniref:hypothetical protein n=1 Tax=Candidatus Wunengus sp. YC60 TaxID=3367697 RepID=UPI004026D95A